MLKIHEINDPEELSSFRWQWNDLAKRTPGASFFQTFDWFSTYWTHFGDDARLRVLVLHEGQQALGIVPLVLRTRRHRLGNVRVLGYPLDNWGSFYGPIGPDVYLTLSAAFTHLARTRRDWDLVELAAVDTLGNDRGRTAMVMAQEGFAPLVEPWHTTSLVNLAACGDWDTYWSSRSSRWRNNVRRSEKMLAARGAVSYVRYRPGGIAAHETDPRWDLYYQCEQIARSSWQGESQTGTTLTHDAVRPFLRDCHRVAARAGAVDLNLLLVDGQAVAFNYAYHYAGNVFGLRTGFDRQAAREGAGSVLQRRMIEDSFARGDHTYDLGPDYLECKRYWQTETRQSDRYTHFASVEPVAQLARVKRGIGRWLAGARGAKHSAVATD
jgi:CelD/BcsL family acetyltransferase involved in cellulose biosynthesis